MSVWQWMTHAPLAGALGWALFHFLWEAALIAGVLFLLRPASARVRYGLSCIAMLSMLAAFGVTLAFFWPENNGATAFQTRVLPRAVNPILPETATQPSPAGIGEYLPLAVPFWISGVFLFYLQYVWSWLAAQRLRRVGTCAAPERWQRRLDELADRTVILLESCLAEAPVVIGHIRPAILLPLGLLAGMPAEQVEAILIHELAHIRRRDYLVNLLQSVVEGLLFYHPAVWWVSRQIRIERENCCDDAVIAAQCNAYEYATALAALEHSRSQAALAANGGSLAKRIRRLLRRQETPHRASAPVAFALLLLASLAAALSAWQPAPKPQPIAAPIQQPVPGPAPASPKPLSSPYRKWLQDDVAYIMTNAERAEFQALQTDAERERFIEKFWLHRDPTKEEHYRRIAYANQHFAAGIPGWMTDRGRTYIIYGPPDEIESHPSGGGSEPAPWENWRYRGVTFTFKDPKGTGEYKLVRKAATSQNGSAGELGITEIRVNHDRTVSITIRVNAGEQPVGVHGKISQNRKPGYVFETSVTQKEFYRQDVGPLAPGQYELSIVINRTGQPVISKTVGFRVN